MARLSSFVGLLAWIYLLCTRTSDAEKMACWEKSDGGASYRGKVFLTKSGYICQAWKSQKPHKHNNDPKSRAYSGLDRNYCRNPDGHSEPWCYTTRKDKRWETCDIPMCTSECWDKSDNGVSYRGTVSSTASGLRCQEWNSQNPHKHTNTPESRPKSGLNSNYCRNPDGYSQPWCYTTEEYMRWEVCDIPICSQKKETKRNVGCWEKSDSGASYRGGVSETKSGFACQAWDSQTPHKHSNTPESRPNFGLDGNYCRNPDGYSEPWCYTTDKDTRWEVCDIPVCAVGCWDKSDGGASYRGAASKTKTGLNCQKWDSQTPHEHSNTPESRPNSGLDGNYCRNPDGYSEPWCYTTDKDTRWEVCGIPICAATDESCSFYPEETSTLLATLNVTVIGNDCQSWDSQYPHKHTRTPEKYPNADLTKNYCRNPDQEAGPWCYTTDPKVRWELCVVLPCTSDCWAAENLGATYRGPIATTENGKICQRWDSQSPHEHTRTKQNYPGAGLHGNYCRNPNKEARPWCYTTNAYSRWEYCSIPECVNAPDATVKCWRKDDKGQSYRGYESKTLSGRTCQKWSSQTPHEHDRIPVDYPSAGLENNYCRVPGDDATSPWCYTTDENVRWEYCAIPTCQKGCTSNPQPTFAPRYRISTTLSGRKCQKWSSQTPHSHTRTQRHYPGHDLIENFCRNPDGESDIWCYTTDPNVRWELCAVPVCSTECWNPAVKGTRYRGSIATTVTGKTCQSWDSQFPHKHNWSPEDHPNLGLTGNSCRNPDESAAPWCFTTDKDKRWEFCSVPECKQSQCWKPEDKGATYKGTVSRTKSGKTCQKWMSQTPHKHAHILPDQVEFINLVHNYCRNPDDSDSPWCYTTDENTRWDYCDIPKCTTVCHDAKDKGASYRGMESTTKSGKNCQQWNLQAPHEHTRTPGNYPGSDLTGNFCRNPDGSDEPWCYTTDEKNIWGYCEVPACG